MISDTRLVSELEFGWSLAWLSFREPKREYVNESGREKKDHQTADLNPLLVFGIFFHLTICLSFTLSCCVTIVELFSFIR